MKKKQFLLELDDETIAYLETLYPVGPGRVLDVLYQLAHAAADGVRRPGAWERDWVVQAFSDDFLERVEPHPEVAYYVQPIRSDFDSDTDAEPKPKPSEVFLSPEERAKLFPED